MRQLLLEFTRPPAPTFANFVPGRNVELLAAVQGAARSAIAERVLYVWGEPGAGKTHLLQAYAQAANAAWRQARDFRAGEATGALVLDDIEDLADAEQAALFNAFNAGAFDFLLVSAHAAPKDLALRRDLASRLATGLVYRVLVLTDEEKRAALDAHADARGFALGEDVVSYLLTHARRDMGSLVSALDAMDRFSLETGRAITVPLLKAALQE